MARLDFYILSEELLSRVEKTSIMNGYRTDHSMVELHIRIYDFHRGNGFWKFNTSLLKDNTYINKSKKLLMISKETMSYNLTLKIFPMKVCIFLLMMIYFMSFS